MYYFALQQHLQTTYTSAISRHFCEAGNYFNTHFTEESFEGETNWFAQGHAYNQLWDKAGNVSQKPADSQFNVLITFKPFQETAEQHPRENYGNLIPWNILKWNSQTILRDRKINFLGLCLCQWSIQALSYLEKPFPQLWQM